MGKRQNVCRLKRKVATLETPHTAPVMSYVQPRNAMRRHNTTHFISISNITGVWKSATSAHSLHKYYTNIISLLLLWEDHRNAQPIPFLPNIHVLFLYYDELLQILAKLLYSRYFLLLSWFWASQWDLFCGNGNGYAEHVSNAYRMVVLGTAMSSYLRYYFGVTIH